MRKTNPLIKLSTVGMIPIVLLISSCGDGGFKEVEQFAKTSAAVKSMAKLVSDDVYASCLRVARKYDRPTSSVFGDTLPDSSRRFPAQTTFNKITEREKRCKNRRVSAATNINNANLVLTNYMEGLGRLASNDTVQFDKNLDALEKSILGLQPVVQGFPQEGVSAGLKIARFIFNRFVLKFRRDNLREAIICANTSVADYASGLQFISQRYYVDGILGVERDAMERYYQSLKPDLSSNESGASERIATFLLRKQYADELEALSVKENAAHAYSGILKATAKTHNDLRNVFNAGSDNSSQKVERSCASKFVDANSSSAIESSSAFSPLDPSMRQPDGAASISAGFSLTPAEQVAVRKILRDYHHQVKPLAEQISQALGKK